jgi:hypothetical protein
LEGGGGVKGSGRDVGGGGEGKQTGDGREVVSAEDGGDDGAENWGMCGSARHTTAGSSVRSLY